MCPFAHGEEMSKSLAKDPIKDYLSVASEFLISIERYPRVSHTRMTFILDLMANGKI